MDKENEELRKENEELKKGKNSLKENISKRFGIAAIEPNYQLANELHKQIIRTFKKRKVYS